MKRGKQYRTEKQDAHARPGNENAKRGGNESQKPCPRDSEKTAEKIAAVSGVSPRTIKNDAHFAEAVDVLVADSVPMARLLEQTNRTAATLMKIGWPISAGSSTGLKSRRMVRRSGTTIGQFKGATNPRKLAPLKKPPKNPHRGEP